MVHSTACDCDVQGSAPPSAALRRMSHRHSKCCPSVRGCPARCRLLCAAFVFSPSGGGGVRDRQIIMNE